MIVSSNRNRYPRAGSVAILCEGDVAGFEVDLLEKLIALRYPEVLADVWACGNQDSIFGVADSIGRTIPLVVIEDRDYRTVEQAREDCDRKRKDRVKRAIGVSLWRTWQRNEIENYLIEPAVVAPVLANYFKTGDSAVILARLESVVECLRVDQAAQCALYQFQHSLPSWSRYVGGLPRKTARPCWDAAAGKIVAPELAHVKNALEHELRGKAKLHVRDSDAIDFESFLTQFGRKCDEWNNVTSGSIAWRIDWAGKDVLISLCRWLAAEFGIPLPPTNHHTRIDWDMLACEKNPDGSIAGKDREIERLIVHDLQPRLVESFLAFLDRGESEVKQEWDSLVASVQQAAAGRVG